MSEEPMRPSQSSAPPLDYAAPRSQRTRWIEGASDVLELLGGWVELAFLVGIYCIMLAPRAGMLAAIPILVGTIIVQVAVVYWLKKV